MNFATPQFADSYSRYMAGLFDEHDYVGVPTGFQQFFGRMDNGSETLFSADANDVDIDIIRANEKTAVLVPRGTVSRPLGPGQSNGNIEKWSAFSRKYPLSEEEFDLDAGQTTQRIAGENPYQRMARQQRLRLLALRGNKELVRRTARLFERLAAQSVLTGKQDAILGTTNPDLQYDFLRSDDNFITPTIDWDASNAIIMQDIDEACLQFRKSSKIQPDFAIVAGDVMQAMLDDSAFQTLADNRRFEMINIGPSAGAGGDGQGGSVAGSFRDSASFGGTMPAKYQRMMDAGLNWRGVLRTAQGFELVLFTYVDGYEADNGDFVQYMTPGKMVIGSSRARADRYFGPPELLPLIPQRIQFYVEMFGMDPTQIPPDVILKAPAGVISPYQFYFDAYASPDWKKVTLRCQSAPIFATTMTDAWVVINAIN